MSQDNARGILALAAQSKQVLVQSMGSARLKKKWRLSNDEIVTAEAILVAGKLITDFHIND